MRYLVAAFLVALAIWAVQNQARNACQGDQRCIAASM